MACCAGAPFLPKLAGLAKGKLRHKSGTRDLLLRSLEIYTELGLHEGVAQVQIRGMEQAQVRVDLIPSRLQAHGLDVRQISQTLREQRGAKPGARDGESTQNGHFGRPSP